MKEKIRNLVVLEGCDLYLVSILTIIICAIFGVKSSAVYISLLCVLLMGLGCFWFSLIWCIVHACNIKEMTRKSKVIKVLLLLFFNLFYIPIYYTKYVMNKGKWYGILGCCANIFVYFLIIGGAVVFAYKTELENKEVVYKTKDELLYVELSGSWTCPKEIAGAYDLYCYETYGDENFGVFNYEKRDDIDYLLEFHLNQEIDYYKDLGYLVVNQGVDQETGFYNAVLKQDNEFVFIVAAMKYATDDFTTILIYNKESDEKVTIDFDSFGELYNKVMISSANNNSV